MALIAILELAFAPDKLDAAREVMSRVIAETRAYEGCQGVDVVIDIADETRWRFIETWASPEHDAAYRAWRAGEGAIADLGPLLAGAPVLTRGAVDPTI
ncbi:antibiotic biosynthesis monooxygenase [Nocardia nova]|uniref:Antibiotic biosynthesis monooxygenase n=1 Tax=Nocardia nova TaxID=37330 RepID=A0A2S6AMX8_9NOCA|nr:putative quinol monooxygenase [Nocardia nova]PPJ25792.1 antibiotic biosynthesis monooxygenase [Nocardia nova]PPJ36578.1 antibiotic biosynthesis monooxygenase [Nocardia nova]